MASHFQYPKLRWPLDLRIDCVQGQDIVLLRCPLGIAPQPLVLVRAVAPILSCFEGNLSIDQIVDKYSQYGVSKGLVEQLVKMLDDHLFLSGPRFFEAERNIRESFQSGTERSAALAGLSYAASATDLKHELNGYLKHGFGVLKSIQGPMVGLVVPHIDYRRGGICYGKTYSYLQSEHHDLYILIGTSHQCSRNLFHLTAKDFLSPLGVLKCDREFVQKLAAQYGPRSFADEILHRNEHSLELQIPFLRHLKEEFQIVPILVGGFHHFLSGDKSPQDHNEYESFVAALAESLRERIAAGKKICVVAGVDMAHVGQTFGDKTALTPEFMQGIENRDKVYLQAIQKQDKHMLLKHVAEDSDARRICGFPTMYTVLDLFDRLGIQYSAQVFDYSQAVDYSSDCAVTFAGVGLYRNQ